MFISNLIETSDMNILRMILFMLYSDILAITVLVKPIQSTGYLIEQLSVVESWHAFLPGQRKYRTFRNAPVGIFV